MSRFKFFIFLIFLSFSLTFAAEECGKVKVGTSFSIGGNYSEPGQWPWLAAILKLGKYQCGASIISKRHLLGAAHCVHPKGKDLFPTQDFHALLGAYDLNKNESNAVKVKFSDISIHPDWDTNANNLRFDADIAVFSMVSEVQFTNLIQPICLPKAHAKIFDVNGTVVGYGLSETSSPHENLPKHVQIKSVEYEDCVFTDDNLARYGSKRMFCAGERGKNPCKGDSGSPFMVREDDQWSINGIVSVALHGECDRNDFVLFTRVPLFLDWIKEIIEGRGQKLECNIDYSMEYIKAICSTESLKILEPNIRITSINFDESLNLYPIEWIGLIQINKAEVHYLPDFSIANKKFPNLKWLWIRHSGLKELDRSKLALLPQLTWLYVEGNKIQELPENVFDDLINLEELWIVNNQVKILPQKLLWKLPKLKEFRADDNQIEAIPARFFEMNKNIEGIWMIENKIKELPENVFDGLINLEVLNIRNNQVKILPQKLLWKLPKLKQFYAERNQIEAIPARLFEMNKNIEGIWMRNNKIFRIEIDLRAMPKLKQFWLNANPCISKDYREGGCCEALSDKDEFQRLINEKCRQ